MALPKEVRTPWGTRVHPSGCRTVFDQRRLSFVHDNPLSGIQDPFSEHREAQPRSPFPASFSMHPPRTGRTTSAIFSSHSIVLECRLAFDLLHWSQRCLTPSTSSSGRPQEAKEKGWAKKQRQTRIELEASGWILNILIILQFLSLLLAKQPSRIILHNALKQLFSPSILKLKQASIAQR